MFFEGTSIDVAKAELEKAGVKVEGVWDAVKVVLSNEFDFNENSRVIKQVPGIAAAVVSFEDHKDLFSKLWTLPRFMKNLTLGETDRKGYGFDSWYFNISFGCSTVDEAVGRWGAIAKNVNDKGNATFVECYVIKADDEVEGYGYYNPYKPNSLDFRNSLNNWAYAARAVLARLGYKTKLHEAGVYRFRY